MTEHDRAAVTRPTPAEWLRRYAGLIVVVVLLLLVVVIAPTVAP